MAVAAIRKPVPGAGPAQSAGLPGSFGADLEGIIDPVVIVGNGPAGMKFATELLNKRPDLPIVIYGDEPYLPYNRIRLSSWLAGEVKWNDLLQPMRRPFGTKYEERIGYRVVQVEPQQQRITDSSGQVTKYSSLVLATGSSAFVPSIDGIEAEGVYTLRNLHDANRLLARRVRSHHTIVIGGGLLGLEAARAMQPLNTRVTVVEHSDRLMARQLDEQAAALLRENVEALGIEVILGDSIKSVNHHSRVTGVTLFSGKSINCDTVVVATGIRPNIELAKDAGISFGRGITVNDHMQTSVANIYAIGECAEHRGELYGLVAPGLEQASVAASYIASDSGSYTGSTSVARLKVLGTAVFSMGPVGAEANPLDGRKIHYVDTRCGVYRTLLIRFNRLVGAIGVGEWSETLRLQSAICDAKRLYPWHLWRFRRTGHLYGKQNAKSLAAWPSSSVICQCMNVTRGTLSDAIASGACSMDDLQKSTCAGTVCGSCKPLLQNLLGMQAKRAAEPFSRVLLVMSIVALLAMLAVALFPGLPYSSSVQAPSIVGLQLSQHWDVLWRDGFYKQVSGFSVLGLSVIASVLSFRKRIALFQRVGRFDIWRLVHVVSGVLVISLLMVHTGFRLGEGLNQWLMVCFLGVIVLGALSATVVSLSHLLGQSAVTILRRQTIWLHIMLFLPLPVLLGWHIFKGYWY